MKDRRDRILEILKRVTKRDVAPAADESLFDSGLLDSFALTDMIAELEKEFGLRVPDSDLHPRKFDTIEHIETYLENHS